jgi:hypothetical protein
LYRIIKDQYIGSSFFDASVSAFMMPSLLQRAGINNSNNETTGSRSGSCTNYNIDMNLSNSNNSNIDNNSNIKITSNNINNNYTYNSNNNSNSDSNIKINSKQNNITGAALGPDWLKNSNILNQLEDSIKENAANLSVHFGQEVKAIKQGLDGVWKVINDSDIDSDIDNDIDNDTGDSWKLPNENDLIYDNNINNNYNYPLYIITSTNKVIGCDFIVSATGVLPCLDFIGGEFELEADALVVNEEMETNIKGIYLCI